MAIPRRDEYGYLDEIFKPRSSSTPVPAQTVDVNPSDFVRNPAQEAAAIAAGVATRTEIEARGGVNASGYYGDSYNPQTSLTDAEYAAAVDSKEDFPVVAITFPPNVSVASFA
jgi:hypothetical protein